jgi:hypothetical protein
MRRTGIGLFVAALTMLASSGLASAACTKPHHYSIGSGPMPSGETWTVTASIKNNGSCDDWLFGLDYSLGEFGNYGSGTGIPAGGHVPREYFKLDAQDLDTGNGSEAALVGYTGNEGTKVVGRMKDGSRFVVKPQLAPAKLRKRVDWLRSFRFFVYFHPTESRIETLSVFSRGGRLIFRTKSLEGSFF